MYKTLRIADTGHVSLWRYFGQRWSIFTIIWWISHAHTCVSSSYRYTHTNKHKHIRLGCLNYDALIYTPLLRPPLQQTWNDACEFQRIYMGKCVIIRGLQLWQGQFCHSSSFAMEYIGSNRYGKCRTTVIMIRKLGTSPIKHYSSLINPIVSWILLSCIRLRFHWLMMGNLFDLTVCLHVYLLSSQRSCDVTCSEFIKLCYTNWAHSCWLVQWTGNIRCIIAL